MVFSLLLSLTNEGAFKFLIKELPQFIKELNSWYPYLMSVNSMRLMYQILIIKVLNIMNELIEEMLHEMQNAK